MSETALTILKYGFLALVYLFLFYVVAVVLRELKNPATPPRRREGKGEGRGFRLRFLEPPNRAGDIVPVTGEMTVGRGGGCNVVLTEDTFASQVHARIYRDGSKLMVEDLKSTNGTFINGQAVTGSMRLRRGDQVRFGQTTFEVTR